MQKLTKAPLKQLLFLTQTATIAKTASIAKQLWVPNSHNCLTLRATIAIQHTCNNKGTLHPWVLESFSRVLTTRRLKNRRAVCRGWFNYCSQLSYIIVENSLHTDCIQNTYIATIIKDNRPITQSEITWNSIFDAVNFCNGLVFILRH